MASRSIFLPRPLQNLGKTPFPLPCDSNLPYAPTTLFFFSRLGSDKHPTTLDTLLWLRLRCPGAFLLKRSLSWSCMCYYSGLSAVSEEEWCGGLTRLCFWAVCGAKMWLFSGILGRDSYFSSCCRFFRPRLLENDCID